MYVHHTAFFVADDFLFEPISRFFICSKFCDFIFYQENGRILLFLLKGRGWNTESGAQFRTMKKQSWLLTYCMWLLSCYRRQRLSAHNRKGMTTKSHIFTLFPFYRQLYAQCMKFMKE